MANLEHETWDLIWDESLSVGIPAIDIEHRHFIDAVNVLSRLMPGRQKSDEIRKLMKWIILDWDLHSKHEEELFREWQYPALDEHVKIHDEITRQLHELGNALDRNESDDELRVTGYRLRMTLVAHLVNDDMKYRDFFLSIKN